MIYPQHMYNCPLGWEDCTICLNHNSCLSGFKPEISAIEKAAKIAEKVTHEEAVSSVKMLKGNMAEEFCKLSSDERMDRFYSWRKQSLHQVEPYKAMQGAIVPGGGGMKNAKKSNKGCKPTVYVWGVFDNKVNK